MHTRRLIGRCGPRLRLPVVWGTGRALLVLVRRGELLRRDREREVHDDDDDDPALVSIERPADARD